MAFTDIEGSTRLLQRVGDRWASILVAHHRVIRAALDDHNGYEVDTAGDGFFVSFARATNAVGFAVDVQRALAADPVLGAENVRVRIGLHTGEVEVNGSDYLGLAVHHAARIASAAHGGQVLLSDATKTMASFRDDDDIDYLDLGEHELKDLARPVRLHQLTSADLAREFPPVRALNARVDRLPVTRSTFVGRESDVAALRLRLASPGLTTLTGPGGCGKTRLAVEAVREALGELPGGAWFVDLRAAASGAQVEEKLVAAISVENVDAVAAKFRGEAAAIVLDNCEHLIDACADLVERLLDACPELRVIATSRDLLGIGAEVARRVPPLGSPSAVKLFADRAGRVDGGFVVDEHNNATVARICTRLDGIPLAIELAAARVRHMSVDALEDRLDDMFRVLVGSDRRALQRHQTLEAVIDWSYQLLEPDERAVLRRLAVFAGGFDLAAADVVCAADGTADIVFRLVDRSLVERSVGDRYHLLETIRAFGQVQLRDDGESDEVRHRHLEHFVAMADRLGPRLLGPEFFDLIDDLEVDVDNIRDAMEWSFRSGDVKRAVRMLGELAPSSHSAAMAPSSRRWARRRSQRPKQRAFPSRNEHGRWPASASRGVRRATARRSCTRPRRSRCTRRSIRRTATSCMAGRSQATRPRRRSWATPATLPLARRLRSPSATPAAGRGRLHSRKRRMRSPSCATATSLAPATRWRWQ